MIAKHYLLLALAVIASLAIVSCSSNKDVSKKTDISAVPSGKLESFALNETQENGRTGINCLAESNLGNVTIRLSVTDGYRLEEQCVDVPSDKCGILNELHKLWWNAGVSQWNSLNENLGQDAKWNVKLKYASSEEVNKMGDGVVPDGFDRLVSDTRRIFERYIAKNTPSLPEGKLTSFSFGTSNGFANASEHFEAEVLDNGKIRVCRILKGGRENSNKEVVLGSGNTTIMDDLRAVVVKNEMVHWKSRYDMLCAYDGSDWSLNFAFGKTSFSSGGYMYGPENYTEAVAELKLIFNRWIDGE